MQLCVRRWMLAGAVKCFMLSVGLKERSALNRRHDVFVSRAGGPLDPQWMLCKALQIKSSPPPIPCWPASIPLTDTRDKSNCFVIILINTAWAAVVITCSWDSRRQSLIFKMLISWVYTGNINANVCGNHYVFSQAVV